MIKYSSNFLINGMRCIQFFDYNVCISEFSNSYIVSADALSQDISRYNVDSVTGNILCMWFLCLFLNFDKINQMVTERSHDLKTQKVESNIKPTRDFSLIVIFITFIDNGCIKVEYNISNNFMISLSFIAE